MSKESKRQRISFKKEKVDARIEFKKKVTYLLDGAS